MFRPIRSKYSYLKLWHLRHEVSENIKLEACSQISINSQTLISDQQPRNELRFSLLGQLQHLRHSSEHIVLLLVNPTLGQQRVTWTR